MNDYFIQFVLAASRPGSEGLFNILIVAFFIVLWVIRNIIMVQKQQKQQQKRPVSNRPSQRAQINTEKAKMQKDRVEQFLESILQPKKMQQHPFRPDAQKITSVAVSGSQKSTVVPVSTQVLTKKPVINVNTPVMTQSHIHTSAADEALGVSIMELPTIDAKLENIPELNEPPIQENQEHLIYHKASQKSPPGLLPSFSDPDALKRAILYAEILGRPISLRESSQIIY